MNDNQLYKLEFKNLSTSWKILIIIGVIAVFILTFSVIAVASMMFSNTENDKRSLKHKDFLEEFKNANLIDNYLKEEVIYPVLPKIKDLKGKMLLNLLEIKIV